MLWIQAFLYLVKLFSGLSSSSIKITEFSFFLDSYNTYKNSKLRMLANANIYLTIYLICFTYINYVHVLNFFQLFNIVYYFSGDVHSYTYDSFLGVMAGMYAMEVSNDWNFFQVFFARTFHWSNNLLLKFVMQFTGVPLRLQLFSYELRIHCVMQELFSFS